MAKKAATKPPTEPDPPEEEVAPPSLAAIFVAARRARVRAEEACTKGLCPPPSEERMAESLAFDNLADSVE